MVRLIIAALICYLTAAAADTDIDNAASSPAATPPAADAAGTTAEYVERVEKVTSAVTGKPEESRVIEFRGTEIKAELAKPIAIIVPRAKPDFDKITLTIYNNEPPSFAPEEYKLNYYRRIPVRDASAFDVQTQAEFAGKNTADAGTEKEGAPVSDNSQP